MVGHEAVGVADPIVAFIGVLEGIEEVQAVLLVLENGFLLVPARRDVVDSTGVFYAEGTGHNVAIVSRKEAIVKLQDVTL
jgi:ATP-dependent protease HslVU (ClpYQ) peptidase subunit